MKLIQIILLIIVSIVLFYIAIFVPSFIAIGTLIAVPIGFFTYPISLTYRKFIKKEDVSTTEFIISFLLSGLVVYIAYGMYMSN